MRIKEIIGEEKWDELLEIANLEQSFDPLRLGLEKAQRERDPRNPRKRKKTHAEIVSDAADQLDAEEERAKRLPIIM